MKIKSTLSLFVITLLIIGTFSSVNYVEAKPNVELPEVSQAPFKVRIIEGHQLRAYVIPLYTTFGNPANYETGTGGFFDGVGDVILTRSDFSVRCSGSLLPTGVHVLIAGHCVTDDIGNLILQSGFVTFEDDASTIQIPVVVSETKVHPDWDGDLVRGNDVAILLLESEAPASITRYDIDRNPNDDVGAVAGKVGYGRSGNGNEGDVLPSGTKRNGQNLYDDTADTMLIALGLTPNVDFVSGSVLQYDFDNGLSLNDGFGFFFGNVQLGLGNAEVNSAPGDSGGPTITNGEITGITSYGLRLESFFRFSTDIDNEVNSSFGEFSGDTRVSKYAAFIDGVLNDTGGTNSAPIADDQSVTTQEDTTISITLTASDSDNDLLNYSVISSPTNGQLSGVAPNLNYAPNQDFNGNDSFTFVANDGTVNSNIATVSITVTPVNDLPVANDDADIVLEGDMVTTNVASNDSDVDDGLDLSSITIISQPANGSVVSNPDGTIMYTHDGSDTTSDTYTYTIKDNGGLESNTATVNITVTSVNPPPSNTLHVSNIVVDGDVKNRGNGVFCKVAATVSIVDQDGNKVKDATVSGTWSDAFSDSVSANTKGGGAVTFRTSWVEGCGTFTFTVNDVLKTGFVYDIAANVETSWTN